MKHDSTMNLQAAAACWRLRGSVPRPPGRSCAGPPAAARSSLAAGVEREAASAAAVPPVGAAPPSPSAFPLPLVCVVLRS
jgi:hypothetical protein